MTVAEKVGLRVLGLEMLTADVVEGLVDGARDYQLEGN